MRSLEDVEQAEAVLDDSGGLAGGEAGHVDAAGDGNQHVSGLADAELAGKFRRVKDGQFQKVAAGNTQSAVWRGLRYGRHLPGQGQRQAKQADEKSQERRERLCPVLAGISVTDHQSCSLWSSP